MCSADNVQPKFTHVKRILVHDTEIAVLVTFTLWLGQTLNQYQSKLKSRYPFFPEVNLEHMRFFAAWNNDIFFVVAMTALCFVWRILAGILGWVGDLVFYVLVGFLVKKLWIALRNNKLSS